MSRTPMGHTGPLGRDGGHGPGGRVDDPATRHASAIASAFDIDLVFVALGLVVAGIAYWLRNGDVETAGILFAALAAYAAWLDGDDE